MAYAIHYEGSWGSLTGGGFVSIYEKDYVGSTVPIKISKRGVKITRNFSDWEQHIILTSCEIDIENDEANYFTLFDLLIATERKYRVVVTKSTVPNQYLLFDGFVNTEAIQQRYLNYSTIRIVASSYVSKLEYVYPTSLDTVGNVVLINGILEILSQAGNTYPVFVSSYLISGRGTSNPNHSFMNQNGVYNEMFWVNNIDRVDSLTILKEILTTFQCYMYFWNNGWYIEDFEELWKTSRHYVKYEVGTEYSPTIGGVGSAATYTIQDVHDLQFIRTTQVVKTIPGCRVVQVRVNNKPFFNLTVNDFRGVAKIGDGALIPATPLRQWYAWQPMAQTLMIWSAQGDPYKTMVNSIMRTSSYVYIPDADNHDLYITAIGGFSRGLYTKFRFTHEGNTDLSIKWKYSTGLPVTTSLIFTFNWELHVYNEEGTFIGYLAWETDQWQLTDFENRINITDISGADFDSVTNICNVEISIPVGEIKDYAQPGDVFATGNYTCVLAILEEYSYINKRTNSAIWDQVWYGDIIITASIDAYDENVIEGTVNTDFIKKLTVTTDISDVPNFNYKNGILEGDDLEYLTDTWYRGAEIVQRKVVDYILIDKFRTGNITRQRIMANVKIDANNPLRPFAMFTESKQSDKKFLLTQMVHYVAEDECEIILDEYDNDTVINLIEE